MARDDYDTGVRAPASSSSDADTSSKAGVESDLSSEADVAAQSDLPAEASPATRSDLSDEAGEATAEEPTLDEAADARSDLSGEDAGPETLDAAGPASSGDPPGPAASNNTPGPASSADAPAPPPSGDDATRIQPVPPEAPGEPSPETAVATVESGTEEAPEGLWPDGMTEELRRRWDAVQMRFVDDPSAVAADAKALVGEAVRSLQDTLSRWEREVQEWATETDDTEELRRAVARYRRRLESLIS